MSVVRRAACPICDRGPRDKAMTVTTDGRGTVSYCHRCGYTSADNIVTDAGMAPLPRTYRPWQDVAAYLWDQSLPLRGSVVQAYLEHRGCRLPPADGDLRYLPARGDHPAAMVARVTDAVTGEPISLHLTRLSTDGRKVGEQPKRLLAGHRKSGGVIRLWPDEAVTHGLAVAEGIETALAAAHVYTPAWAAVDAGNLASLPVLAGIESLMVIADHDPAGIRAGQECARRWSATGCQVRIALPRTPGADAADVGVAA